MNIGLQANSKNGLVFVSNPSRMDDVEQSTTLQAANNLLNSATQIEYTIKVHEFYTRWPSFSSQNGIGVQVNLILSMGRQRVGERMRRDGDIFYSVLST